jgi:hypothetical protein
MVVAGCQPTSGRQQLAIHATKCPYPSDPHAAVGGLVEAFNEVLDLGIPNRLRRLVEVQSSWPAGSGRRRRLLRPDAGTSHVAGSGGSLAQCRADGQFRGRSWRLVDGSSSRSRCRAWSRGRSPAFCRTALLVRGILTPAETLPGWSFTSINFSQRRRRHALFELPHVRRRLRIACPARPDD